MNGVIWLLWFGNIVFDTGGQMAFKAGAQAENKAEGLRYWLVLLSNPWIVGGIACYVAEFLIWLAFLSMVPLSQGILLGSINIVSVMLAGRIFFHEKLVPLRVLGIALVSVGVTLAGLEL